MHVGSRKIWVYAFTHLSIAISRTISPETGYPYMWVTIKNMTAKAYFRNVGILIKENMNNIKLQSSLTWTWQWVRSTAWRPWVRHRKPVERKQSSCSLGNGFPCTTCSWQSRWKYLNNIRLRYRVGYYPRCSLDLQCSNISILVIKCSLTECNCGIFNLFYIDIEFLDLLAPWMNCLSCRIIFSSRRGGKRLTVDLTNIIEYHLSIGPYSK